MYEHDDGSGVRSCARGTAVFFWDFDEARLGKSPLSLAEAGGAA